jgi:hypothetical protein
MCGPMIRYREAFAGGARWVRHVTGSRKKGTMTTGNFTCRELVELVTDYLEGVLANAVHTTVAEHLRGCAGCTAYVNQMRATVDALGATPSIVPDAQWCRRLEEAFRSWFERREDLTSGR